LRALTKSAAHRATAFMFLFAALQVAHSQSITITGPSSNVAVEDGDDFATDVVGHPWSMDQVRDFGMDYGFADPVSVNGEWQAQSLESLAYYQPLFQGFNDLTYSMYFTRYDDGTPYGSLNPIDTSKYTCLSMRSSLPASVRSSLSVFWTKNPGLPAITHGVGLVDTLPAVNGYRMYNIDLNVSGWYSDRNAPLTPGLVSVGQPWQSTVYGLMVRPALNFPFNTTHKVDWMRLYDPTTSPTVQITWSTSGVPGGSTYGVQLFLDDNASGYNGDLFVSGLSNDGSYTLRTAALPPGDYYAYFRVVQLSGQSLSTIATSGYSARIRIDAAPVVAFTAPSFTSGEEYSASALANAWDMNQASDVDSYFDVYWPGFQGGVLTALAGSTDPQVRLNTRRNGAVVPIDPRKYRYLTFRMDADETGTVNFIGRMLAGWVARLIWWNAGSDIDGTVSKDIPVLEGWHSYTLDLWDSNLPETSGYELNPQPGWKNMPTIKGLRIDPLECFNSTFFNYDDVKLCAENRPINGSYTVKWDLSDADSASVDLKVYYGYMDGSTYVEESQPLVDQSVSPGPGNYVWDMSNMPNGNYHLRFEVDDGTNLRSYKSELPIIIDDSYPRMSLNGMDPTIYYRNNGWWITLHADGSGYTIMDWGHPVVEPAPADYDNDGIMDCAVYWRQQGNWYIRESSTGQMMTGNPITLAGNRGDPVPADYDGDGLDDIATFDANGNWYILQSSNGQLKGGGPINWGWGGVTPVPGDYDNDGTADLAVFNAGEWWILQSSNGQAMGGGGIPWGWAGTIPVPGDYDGDGATDLAVFDPVGTWYILQSSNGQMLEGGGISWGWNETQPVPGDYDNDGKTDLVAYHTAEGMWYFRFSGGGSESGGRWGWNGATSVPISGNFVTP